MTYNNGSVVRDLSTVGSKHVVWFLARAENESKVQVEHDLQVAFFVGNTNNLVSLATGALEDIRSYKEFCSLTLRAYLRR